MKLTDCCTVGPSSSSFFFAVHLLGHDVEALLEGERVPTC
jgi:hypothetical protein